jgi:5S rRNA maturation endonuclease (ribonuclease M5)
MTESVVTSARISRLQEYGKERLPAGDLSGEEIIVVEGRADVQNLLKHGINNVIGMSGTVLTETIKEIGRGKTLTLFVDGDRGGVLIVKNTVENARIDFVAMAPPGKEVEELSGKEIIAALRKKIPTQEFMQQIGVKKTRGFVREGRTAKRSEFVVKSKEKPSAAGEPIQPSEKEKEVFQSRLYDLIGTRGAYVLDSELNIIRKVPLSELIFALNSVRNEVYAVILDGTATSELIRTCERTSCKHIVAKNFASFTTRINLVSL